MANRKKAESFIIEYIEKLTPGSGNSEMYKKIFKKMSDNEFDDFMKDLETGDKFLSVIEPNFEDTVTLENNLKLAEELGHNFFERLWIEGKDGEPTYLTPNSYLVVDLPLRRVSQTLDKKASIPKDTKSVDKLSGQYVGKPAGAKISYPELQIAASMELDESLEELMKFRGGDSKGKLAYEKSLSTTGKANLRVLEKYSSGVESTKTLKAMLISAHLSNTL